MLRRFAIVASTTAVLSTALIASFGAGAGCTHDREPPTPPVDAPKVDVNLDSKTEVPPVTVLKDGVDVPANLKCFGMPRTEPTPMEAGVDEAGTDGAIAPGTLVEKQIELIGFGTGGADKLGDQTIDVFYSNKATGTPDQTVTTDPKGLFKVTVPDGLRIAYKVRASDKLEDYFGLDDLHMPAVVPGLKDPIIRWQGVTRERREFFALALTNDKTWVPKPGNGVVAVRVFDCDRRLIQYAKIELLDFTDDPKGVKLTFGKCGEELCRVFLTDSELPDVGRETTSRSALFSLLDVPTGRKLRVVAYSTKADGTTEEIGWRDLSVTENVITTQFIEPNNPKTF